MWDWSRRKHAERYEKLNFIYKIKNGDIDGESEIRINRMDKVTF